MEPNQSAPGLNRGLSSNFLRLKSVNHMKFTALCTEKCVLVKKNLDKWGEYRFATMSLNQKDVLVKKKFWAQQPVKEGLSLLISLKNVQLIIVSYCQVFRLNSPYLLNDSHYEFLIFSWVYVLNRALLIFSSLKCIYFLFYRCLYQNKYEPK